jgi:probable F420-dependent oxidoreductase
MRVGVVCPQIELRGDPFALRRFAVAAEELGYRHLVLYDHVVGASHGSFAEIASPYSERDPFHDPFTAFAFLAASTREIELVTGILILPQRQTVLVARQAADVDLMSGGRLRLGVAAGYNPTEYEALGADFSRRGRRLDEQIAYLRRLFTEELITFDGEFHRLDRANIVPRPARDIPIWCGGFSDVAYRRAVRAADGFIFGYGLTPAASDGWCRVRELLGEAGRELEGFGAHFLLHPPEGSYDDREVIVGLSRLRESGATDASVFTMGRGFTDVEEHIRYLARMRDLLERADLLSAVAPAGAPSS